MTSWGGGYPLNPSHKKHIALFGFTFLLTACGADIAAVYERDLYQTNIYEENHYVDTVIASTFHSDNIAFSTTWNFPDTDVSNDIPTSNDDPFGDAFALNEKLSHAMPSIGYGFESKLFDGILFCTDAQRISKSRLQLLPSGFGYVFPKTLSTYQTLGLFMKAGADTNQGAEKILDMNVSLSLYKPSSLGWEQYTLVIEIKDLVASNFPGYYEITLPTNVLTGIQGLSLTYEIVNPQPATEMTNLTGLFLYEVLFPGSTWH